MRKVFSSNVVSETALVRDALAHHGVEVTILNEYSGGSAVPEFRPPAEIWVRNDDDYKSARQVVVDTLATLDSKSDAPPWVCSSCREENPQSFEACWNCGREIGDAARRQ
jgi:Putative prokaryotic signal transducing protein